PGRGGGDGEQPLSRIAMERVVDDAAHQALVALYLYPFLNTVYKTREYEFLRLTSLGVIGAPVKGMIILNHEMDDDRIECLSHHLKKVVLKGYRGQKHQTQLDIFLVSYVGFYMFSTDSPCPVIVGFVYSFGYHGIQPQLLKRTRPLDVRAGRGGVDRERGCRDDGPDDGYIAGVVHEPGHGCLVQQDSVGGRVALLPAIAEGALMKHPHYQVSKKSPGFTSNMLIVCTNWHGGKNYGGIRDSISKQTIRSDLHLKKLLNVIAKLVAVLGILKYLIKRLYSLLTIKESAAIVPKNLEARRRLHFFTNSLFMEMPVARPVSEMVSFSVFTPYYSEIVLYNMAELQKKNED
ncbi:hypothetical protein ACJX0J_039693, partial [Zea mays]